ncbi:hypothetical protein BGZ92_002998 [Podila epicladia]|nr:hypothetical protein BGZ92_002998 [Podila epicladia]
MVRYYEEEIPDLSSFKVRVYDNPETKKQGVKEVAQELAHRARTAAGNMMKRARRANSHEELGVHSGKDIVIDISEDEILEDKRKSRHSKKTRGDGGEGSSKSGTGQGMLERAVIQTKNVLASLSRAGSASGGQDTSLAPGSQDATLALDDNDPTSGKKRGRPRKEKKQKASDYATDI